MKKRYFEVYYQYDGPSHSDPFAKMKSEKEIQDALDNFVNEFPHYLNDLGATAVSEPVKGDKNRIKVTIETTDEDQVVETALVKCLQSLDLRAKII